MRIEAYNNVSQIYKPQAKTKVNNVKKTAYQPDQLQISNFGRDLQAVKQAVSGAPDIREDLTSSIQSRLNAGTYNVDTGDFAEKLMAKYQEKYVF
ncbi:MAG: flagellar biosynthesis anti-sigma factor FlgM [Lachnospiraceae bacterium]|nr:flagellar biosynthesis anti-sigma factor FlgM [Lachnospiraceae bacterium]